MKRLTEHMYIISLDGLGALDFEYIKTLPNFKELLNGASYCKNVFSVYPTLTYPAHVSIVTGKYPKNHGVINNTLMQPNRKSPDWYWQRKNIKGKTLYDLAIEKGMKVGAILWPVTAKSKIQFNMPEILAKRPWENQILVSLLNGTPLFQYDMNKKYGHLRNGITQPNLDNFTHEVFLDCIRNKNLDLMLVHYTDLDSIRHEFGFASKEAKEALNRHDKRLGDIVREMKKKGIYEESTIVVLGDHSSLDEDKVINLNVIFKENALINTNSNGKIIGYKALLKNCDGSAYVYIENDDMETLNKVKKLIYDFNKKFNCIEAVYSKEEAEELGADSNCMLMLEARKGYYFQDDMEGESLVKIKEGDSRYTLATHGYLPFKKDYTTVFIAKGKGIREGVMIDTMDLIDEGPTMASLLGVELQDIDGRIIEEIIDREGVYYEKIQ